MRKLAYFIIILILPNILMANTLIIKGNILDGTTNEAIPGVTIIVEGTSYGTVSNFDGSYELKLDGIKNDFINIKYSFISYQTLVVEGVKVKNGEITLPQVKLTPEDAQIGDVVVQAKSIKNTENALLSVKGKSTSLIDGISSKQISKMGDSDAAGALKRVTGLSVEGGKYVYVRGLGDRYSKITMNGASIPGLDPNRNTVQMDIFPTSIIENMIVSKTFSPNLPGDFSGGHIDITTKTFPSKLNLEFSSSFGYNPQANFINNYLSSEGGKFDMLGIDDGTRNIPAEAANVPFYSNPNKEILGSITKAFNKTMEPVNTKSSINQSYTFAIGNKTKLLGKQLGYNFGLSYKKAYNHYNNGQTGYYKLTGFNETQLNQEYSYADTKSNTDILIGGIASIHYKLNKNNKIGINIIRNQNAENSARYMYGEAQTDEVGAYRQTRTIKFVERALTSFQAKGDHTFSKIANTNISWTSSYTISQQDEPDLRFFTNGHFPNQAGTSAEYEISPSKYKVPTRLFRNLWENNLNNRLDITVPFNFNGNNAEIKAGTYHVYKSRIFSEQQFDYIRNTDNFNGSISDYLSDQNIGINANGDFGLYIQDVTNTKNSYDASQNIFANYLMIDIPLNQQVRLTTGARIEKTNIFSKSKNEKYETGELNLLDVLPSVNFIYKPVQKMNFRTAYSRTLARPTFREIAPFESEDFQGGIVYVGNPELQRTLIDNIDFRWEYFTNPGEIISVSGFYKNFTNPIELADDTRSNNPQLTWKNVDKAQVAGFELEARKNIKISSSNNMLIGSNYTYLKSFVSIDSLELQSIREQNPDHNGTRVMYGQAPYIFNAFLNYTNTKSDFEANIAYNISGAKLAVVMRSPTPNVFEQPSGQLNFNMSKKFGKQKRFVAKLSANNILNSTFKSTYNYNGTEYIFSKYTKGRTFSFGIKYLID